MQKSAVRCTKYDGLTVWRKPRSISGIATPRRDSVGIQVGEGDGTIVFFWSSASDLFAKQIIVLVHLIIFLFTILAQYHIYLQLTRYLPTYSVM